MPPHSRLLRRKQGLVLGSRTRDRWPCGYPAHVFHDFGTLGHELERRRPAKRRSPQYIRRGNPLAEKVRAPRECRRKRVDHSIVFAIWAHRTAAGLAAKRTVNDSG